jgi:hypothetical protein
LECLILNQAQATPARTAIIIALVPLLFQVV